MLAGGIKFTRATRSVSKRHIWFNSKVGPSDRLCCGLGRLVGAALSLVSAGVMLR
jgi:hypothetical protein